MHPELEWELTSRLDVNDISSTYRLKETAMRNRPRDPSARRGLSTDRDPDRDRTPDTGGALPTYGTPETGDSMRSHHRNNPENRALKNDYLESDYPDSNDYSDSNPDSEARAGGRGRRWGGRREEFRRRREFAVAGFGPGPRFGP